jgi:hypothetical protein
VLKHELTQLIVSTIRISAHRREIHIYRATSLATDGVVVSSTRTKNLPTVNVPVIRGQHGCFCMRTNVQALYSGRHGQRLWVATASFTCPEVESRRPSQSCSFSQTSRPHLNTFVAAARGPTTTRLA